MNEKTRNDWDFADMYLPAAFNVLRENASFLVSFEVAPSSIDLKEMGDIVLSSNMGYVAFRVRRPNVDYRDLTIRARRGTGAETEISKIRKGLGRWYLYAWSDGKHPNGNRKFKDWILVDLDEFRNSGLAFEDREEKPNGDGTWFFAYPDIELELSNCLVARHNSRIERRDHWTSFNKLNHKYPGANFQKVPVDSVTEGDIYQFISPKGESRTAEIIGVNGGSLARVGLVSWVQLKPETGKVIIYRRQNGNNNA